MRGGAAPGRTRERVAADRGMLAEVLAGLARPQKELSSRWFYDHRGSELFEEITELEEYYPSRTEKGLLEGPGAAWVEALRPATLVELGAGSARKTRVLLDPMERERPGGLYIPVDVSAEFLEASAAQIRDEYPALRVRPRVADISQPLTFPGGLWRPVLMALLGSTIGNFHEDAAVRLLANVRASMEPDDLFLLGADLRPGASKSLERLEAAYNDARGVTADFNLNVLHVLNRDVGADFDVAAFHHRAFYDRDRGRIEMHLVADADQTVRFADGSTVGFDEGESVRTEISCKYDRPTVDRMFDSAGLRVRDWAQDAEDLFALILGEPV